MKVIYFTDDEMSFILKTIKSTINIKRNNKNYK